MMDAVVKNAADQEQIRLASGKERKKRERELLDFRAIMETSHGRRFVSRMLDICGFQKTNFTGDNSTFFYEGMREIGLVFWRDMNEACPDLYLTMIKEAQVEEKRNG